MLNGSGFLIGIWVMCLECLGRVKQQKESHCLAGWALK